MLLDGSDSRFRWEVVDGARDPGLVPFSEMPLVQRTDYVFNANDSFWVPNAEFPLTGSYSILHGEQGTPLTMRTRQNAAVLGADNAAGLAGADGLFDAEEIRTAAFENSGRSALLLRSAAVDACRATPIVEVPDLLAADGSVSLPAASVDLTAACNVLAGWDGVYDLDRAGPMIWRETMDRFDAAAFENAGALFDDPFDPARPTLTPSIPASDTGPLLQAMARAVQTITTAGFALDTTLGASQFTERSETRIPIHGGNSADGVTNIVTWSGRSSSSEPAPQRGEAVAVGSSLRGDGYRVNYGTSFVMTVDYTGDDVRGVGVARVRPDRRSHVAAVRLPDHRVQREAVAQGRVHRRADRGRPRPRDVHRDRSLSARRPGALFTRRSQWGNDSATRRCDDSACHRATPTPNI